MVSIISVFLQYKFTKIYDITKAFALNISMKALFFEVLNNKMRLIDTIVSYYVLLVDCLVVPRLVLFSTHYSE